jgi:hypothetical protein
MKTAWFAWIALPTLVACGAIASDFLPNTERGLLEITVARAANTSQDEVTETRTNDRLRYMRPVLARALPAGVEVDVEAAASDFGPYRFGGGWITRGTRYLGQHAVPTELVKVISSDDRVVTAELVCNPADPMRQVAKLVTLQPGVVRLRFVASRLDGQRQRVGAIVEDSITLTIGEGPVIEGSPAIAKPAG